LATIAVMAASVAVFVFHLGVFPVLSDSMAPTYSTGALVLTRPIPASRVRVGDIVVIRPPGYTASYAHRVVSVKGSPEHPIIRTKGDANAAPDPWEMSLTSSQVPEVVGSVPFLGRIAAPFDHSRETRVLVIAGGGAVFLIGGLVLILSGGRRPEDDRDPSGPVHSSGFGPTGFSANTASGVIVTDA
jgi:signal peptidase